MTKIERTAAVLMTLLLSACSGADVVPTMPVLPTPPPANLAAPLLVSPASGTVIQQDDPGTGCPAHPAFGAGHQIRFEWTPSPEASRVSAYQVYAKRVTSTVPLVDVQVNGTAYRSVKCDGFVTSGLLDGWEARVRAVGPDGEAGPWSNTVTFSYAECPTCRFY
jgi:hypothetical protein